MRPRMLLLIRKCGIEGCRRRCEINILHILAGFFRSEFTVHSAVFPFDGKRSLVSNPVQGANNPVEINIAAADGNKIPVAVFMTELQVSAKNTSPLALLRPPDILHMGMINSLSELQDELYIVHPLIAKVTGIIIKAESLPPVQGLDGEPRRGDIESDLRWMHFQPKPYSDIIKDIQ